MKTYRAKKKHGRPCDACGESIIRDDDVVTWAWANDEEFGGNIMRVHATCQALIVKHHLEEERWNLGTFFEDRDEECEEPALVLQAATALQKARSDRLQIENPRIYWALQIAERVAFKLTPDQVLLDARDKYIDARSQWAPGLPE